MVYETVQVSSVPGAPGVYRVRCDLSENGLTGWGLQNSANVVEALDLARAEARAQMRVRALRSRVEGQPEPERGRSVSPDPGDLPF